jgi:hypothetical protein
VGASHVLDLIPFDPQRLASSAWGGRRKSPWLAGDYTELDVCGGTPWPFADRHFDLGLCSHTLEDVRDPVPVLRELCRVSKKILLIFPSRLLEQTRNIEHPKFPGFPHHPWILFEERGELVFRRKTFYLNFRGCYLTCPFGKTLPVDLGSSYYFGGPIRGRELAYWSGEAELNDYRSFLDPYRGKAKSLFVRMDPPARFAHWIYYLKQRFGGVP